jgi:hypothetical protein
MAQQPVGTTCALPTHTLQSPQPVAVWQHSGLYVPKTWITAPVVGTKKGGEEGDTFGDYSPVPNQTTFSLSVTLSSSSNPLSCLYTCHARLP